MSLSTGCSLYFKLNEPSGTPRADAVSGTVHLPEGGTVANGPGLKSTAADFTGASGQQLSLASPSTAVRHVREHNVIHA